MTDGLRELREEDAEAVARLFREAFGESRPLDGEEVRTWLRNEALEPEWLRVLEVDGRVVGYGDVFVQDDELALDAAAPGQWDVFFDWAEDEARSAGARRVRTFFLSGHELADVTAARGYQPSRSSFVMEVELDRPPTVPPLPAGIELRPYRNVDEDVVRAAVNESFSEDPLYREASPEVFREFNIATRGFDPEVWLLAWDGDELAGVSLNYKERVGEPGLGWVGILAVRSPWRRRGLGDALLRASFAALYERGLRRVGLGVDTENVTGALRLYERAGMRPVRQTDSWVLEL
jgi:mycothiol synthase